VNGKNVANGNLQLTCRIEKTCFFQCFRLSTQKRRKGWSLNDQLAVTHSIELAKCFDLAVLAWFEEDSRPQKMFDSTRWARES
jgi:hypothetical protein